MPQYVTNVKSADLCQYDVQYDGSRFCQEIDSESNEDRQPRRQECTRLVRDCRDCRAWHTNRMRTADCAAPAPSLTDGNFQL